MSLSLRQVTVAAHSKSMGDQDWGIRDYTYTRIGEYETLEIPVGLYLGGRNLFVSFANDDDRDSSGKGYFRNVRLVEQ